MATPHIKAEVGDIAEVVLMPGDPLRAKFIADKYLQNVVQFNNIRNMFGYTGYYEGKRISVMGSGMGMPSIGIYSYELYKFFDVKKIIRIGTCGSLKSNINLFDVILVERAYSDSSYAYVQNGNTDDINSSSSKLTDKIGETARNIGMNIVRGNVYTTDVFSFYRDTNLENQVAKKYECIASEMECFALFHNAQVLGKEAACVLTVVDTIVKRENVSAMEREKKLSDSIELVLKSI